MFLLLHQYNLRIDIILRYTYSFQPYPYSTELRKEKIFNYRLSRARRISENYFGILAKRFEVLMSAILQNYENAVATVLACISLHNYLRERMPDEALQVPDEALQIEVCAVFVAKCQFCHTFVKLTKK